MTALGSTTSMIGRKVDQAEIEKAVREIGEAMMADMPNIVARSIAEAFGMPGNEAAIAVIRKWIEEANASAGRHEL